LFASPDDADATGFADRHRVVWACAFARGRQSRF